MYMGVTVKIAKILDAEKSVNVNVVCQFPKVMSIFCLPFRIILTT